MKKALEEKGLKVLELSFAGYLKAIVNNNFPTENKEEYRDTLQWFGTEVVRKLEEDFWVHIVYHTIDLLARRKTVEDLANIEMNQVSYIGEDKKIYKKQPAYDRFLDFAEKESLKYDAFIITDARFENELQPKSYSVGYDINNVKINREDTTFRMNEEQRKHQSEKLSTEKPDNEFFAVIDNNGTLEELEVKCIKTVEKCIEFREKRCQELLKECEEVLKKYKQE